MIKLKYLHHAMKACEAVSTSSIDPKTQVGAALVNPNNGIIVGLGYNGSVRGTDDSVIPLYDDDKHEYMIHAEMNAIASCVMQGANIIGCVLVCTHTPCTSCARFLMQCGITEIYAKTIHNSFHKTINMKDIWVLNKKHDIYTYIKLSGDRNENSNR